MTDEHPEGNAGRGGGPSAEDADELRPLLMSIAYRMVGSFSEAEDIVQEATVRFHRATRRDTKIESTRAYLTAVTTRLGIDHLRSARVRREAYVGPWLPDPLVDELAPDLAQEAELADSLSTAFLVLLETLSPLERAVFLLREIFDFGYDEIAEVVGKSEANCRQIAVRARRRIEAGQPRFEPSRQKRDELSEHFFAAARNGDLAGLVNLLAGDAAFHGDGGDKGNGFPRPVIGRERVGRLVVGAVRKLDQLGIRLGPVHVGGQPGVLLLDPEDRLVGVWSLHIADGVIRTIHGVVNPDKIGHLGATSPLSRRPQTDEGAQR
jgi:RNA polymerase sigma-70 factor (TIGR02957 family)